MDTWRNVSHVSKFIKKEKEKKKKKDKKKNKESKKKKRTRRIVCVRGGRKLILEREDLAYL